MNNQGFYSPSRSNYHQDSDGYEAHYQNLGYHGHGDSNHYYTRLDENYENLKIRRPPSQKAGEHLLDSFMGEYNILLLAIQNNVYLESHREGGSIKKLSTNCRSSGSIKRASSLARNYM